MSGVNQFREGGACKWLCRVHRKLLPSHPLGSAAWHLQEWKRDLGRQCGFPNRLPKNPILPQRENAFVDSDISSSSSSKTHGSQNEF